MPAAGGNTLKSSRNENVGQIKINKNIRDANGDSKLNYGSWRDTAPTLLENLVSESLDNSKDTICDEDEETNLIHQLSPVALLDLGMIKSLTKKNICIYLN